MLRLIETNEGERRELGRGSLEEIVEYLRNSAGLYDWMQEQDSDTILPNFENIEAVRDLEYELEKIDMSWWDLTLVEIK